jgi:protocatechuate 3,4-dioxygenase beta subunit
MTRKDFIKNAGLGLISGPFVLKGTSYFQTRSLLKARPPAFNCVLSPAQTGGPFYLDPKYHRKNITEDQPGLPLKLKIKVIGVNNCEPVPQALVNIWHCNAEGGYSEFGKVAGNPTDASEANWLRGYQITDENGYCEFDTIFPGWYRSRATHIHFDVHLGYDPNEKVDGRPNRSSTFYSQMYLPNNIKTRVYTEHSAYTARGDDPTGNYNDRLYQNTTGSDALMLTFDESDYPNALTGHFTIGLDMSGSPTKAQNLEGRKYFQLRENHPNPFSTKTKLDFRMLSPGSVTLSVVNSAGEVAAQLMNRSLPTGDYAIEFDRKSPDYYLLPGTYFFDMQVQNQHGRFRQSRKLVIT